jgi:phage FluMu protein gp41
LAQLLQRPIHSSAALSGGGGGTVRSRGAKPVVAAGRSPSTGVNSSQKITGVELLDRRPQVSLWMQVVHSPWSQSTVNGGSTRDAATLRMRASWYHDDVSGRRKKDMDRTGLSRRQTRTKLARVIALPSAGGVPEDVVCFQIRF